MAVVVYSRDATTILFEILANTEMLTSKKLKKKKTSFITMIFD